MKYSIYTDASSRSDLNCTAYGYLVVDEDGIILRQEIESAKFSECNSSRGELLAVTMAYNLANCVSDEDIEVVTDSNYVFNAVNGYIRDKNNFTKNKKKLKKNLYDIMVLAELVERMSGRVTLKVVKSHSCYEFNNKIDKEVRRVARGGELNKQKI